jgi:hypothetical protein
MEAAESPSTVLSDCGGGGQRLQAGPTVKDVGGDSLKSRGSGSENHPAGGER